MRFVEFVTSEPESNATGAFSVLRIYKDDPKLCERIAVIVRERAIPSLQAVFDRDFLRDTP
jgi:hypothetical protein